MIHEVIVIEYLDKKEIIFKYIIQIYIEGLKAISKCS
jgi:hypothetical protein